MLEENGSPMNLVSSIEINAKHYLDIMSKAVDKVMPDATREIKYGPCGYDIVFELIFT